MLRRTMLALPFLAAPAFAARPVRLIVPVPPGSVPDIVARILAERLPAAWDAHVLVENRPGASGAIGTEAAARAPADGTALLIGSSGPLAVLPAVRRDLPYDPLADFRPLARLAEFPLVLVAARNAGLPDMATLLRRRAEAFDAAAGDPASTQHLALALLARQSGLRLTHIPYRAGRLAHADLIAGRLALMAESLAAILPAIRDGAALPLAVFGEARSPAIPAVPTLAESGVAGAEAAGWIGLLAPARLPDAAAARLEAGLRAVLSDPDTLARLSAAGADPAVQDAAPFARFLRQDLERWRALAAATGITAG